MISTIRQTTKGAGQITLTVKPCQNVKACKNGIWSVVDMPALLELIARGHVIPSGWILLQGQLHRRGTDFTARLFVEVGRTKPKLFSYDIPVTRKGTILELFRLPENVHRLLLQPMASTGDFELENLTITSIGTFERVYRMLRRVIPAFIKYPRVKRLKAGLCVSQLFWNIDKAYRIVGRFRAYSPCMPYNQWIEHFCTISVADRQMILRDIGARRHRKHFVLVVQYRGEPVDQLLETIASLRCQLYPSYEIIIASTSEHHRESIPEDVPFIGADKLYGELTIRTRDLKNNKKVGWVILLTPGTRLSEHALYWFARTMASSPGLRVVYSDHDHLDKHGVRTEPVLKPDWSPEHLRATNYIDQSVAFHVESLLGCFAPFGDLPDWSNGYSLLLRTTEQLPEKLVGHIAAILFHLPERNSYESEDNHGVEDVKAHLSRLGVRAEVRHLSAFYNRIYYTLPSKVPRVSIVIPTRDALPLLKACISSILSKTRYKHYEIIIVDNQSVNKTTHAYFAVIAKKKNVRVLSYPQPFNYAAINNAAIQQANGKIVCLLNNDTEVISPDWLDEMVGHLVQRKVGVVGAKLLYSDGRVQHGGDTVGPGGCAHHLHSFLGGDEVGYCNRAMVAQELSAVTGACLLTWTSLYRRLGGLNEQHLPVAFNDVDYCLRVREAGYKVVWTPHAVLYHHESLSRGKDDTPEKMERSKREARYMRERWGHLMHHDPFYNQNLSYERADFSLSNAPAVVKPWIYAGGRTVS